VISVSVSALPVVYHSAAFVLQQSTFLDCCLVSVSLAVKLPLVIVDGINNVRRGRPQCNRLEVFHLHCVRRIMSVMG